VRRVPRRPQPRPRAAGRRPAVPSTCETDRGWPDEVGRDHPVLQRPLVVGRWAWRGLLGVWLGTVDVGQQTPIAVHHLMRKAQKNSKSSLVLARICMSRSTSAISAARAASDRGCWAACTSTRPSPTRPSKLTRARSPLCNTGLSVHVCSQMPPSRTVAPYSPPKTIAQPRAVSRHGRHPPPFIPDTRPEHCRSARRLSCESSPRRGKMALRLTLSRVDAESIPLRGQYNALGRGRGCQPR
jgi:hypothetical protein